MGILIVMAAISGIGFLVRRVRGEEDPWELLPIGTVIGWAMLIFTILGLLMMPLVRLSINADIEGFLAIKQSIEEARANGDISEVELAALQHKVVEANQWLAVTQYQARLFWTWGFVPVRVLELEPIR